MLIIRAISTAARAGLRSALPSLLALVAAAAHAQSAGGAGPCGDPFKNHFGPFDYRSAPRADVEIVEKYHFTPGIESLTKPVNTTFQNMAQDVAYTLHVFPNHHRALMTMTRLGERHKTDQPPGAAFTVDCYLRRAVMYRPDDTTVRGIYALYLNKNNRRAEALQHLGQAVQRAGDNAVAHYTIGTVYFELADHEAAVAQAHKARALGDVRTGLEAALRNAGKWREPAAPASAPAASSAAAGASAPGV